MNDKPDKWWVQQYVDQAIKRELGVQSMIPARSVLPQKVTPNTLAGARPTNGAPMVYDSSADVATFRDGDGAWADVCTWGIAAQDSSAWTTGDTDEWVFQALHNPTSHRADAGELAVSAANFQGLHFLSVADYGTSPSFRLKWWCVTNATAPTTYPVIRVRKATSFSGGIVSATTLINSHTANSGAALSANTAYSNASNETTLSLSGNNFLLVTWDWQASPAAGSIVSSGARLQVQLA